MKYRKITRKSTVKQHSLAGILITLTCAPLPVFAQTQPLQTPPSPTGVIPSYQGAPPTGMQAAVPAPAVPVQSAEKPLRRSPLLSQISARLQGEPLKINDAIAIALAENRNLAFAQEALLRAEGRTSETRALLNPTVGIAPGYVYQDDKLEPQALFGVTLPVDISGMIHAAGDQAKFQEIGYRLEINRARNQTVADVKAAFYDALRANALVRVSEENLRDSLERLSDSEKKLQARAVTRYDVIRAQTDVAAAQQQVIRAHNAVQRSLGFLNNMMGLDILTPLKLDETGATELPPGISPLEKNPPTLLPEPNPIAMPNVQAGPSMEVPSASARNAQGPSGVQPEANSGPSSEELGPEFQSVLKEALATRPEILEADANIAAAQRGIQLARSSELPTVGLSAGYYNLRNSTGTTRIDDMRAFASISIPLFDGGLARSRTREARATVASAQTSRRQALDQVTLDIQQAYLNLIQTRDEVAVAIQGLTQARQGFALARVRYTAGVSARAGISPLLEVSDAQAALTLAESNQVNALYDYNNARAQLDRAVGRFAYVPNGPGYITPLPETKIVNLKDIR